MDQYGQGDVVHVMWTLTNNTSGVLVNSTSQTFKYIDPTGVQTNVVYTDGVNGIVIDGLGNYHYDLPVSKAGMWWTRVEIGPPNQGEGEYRFEVRATRFS